MSSKPFKYGEQVEINGTGAMLVNQYLENDMIRLLGRTKDKMWYNVDVHISLVRNEAMKENDEWPESREPADYQSIYNNL